MEKRALLAVALAFVIILVYQYLFIKPEPQKVQKPTKVAETEKSVPAESPATSIMIPETKSVPSEEKEIRVDTNLYSAVFTTRGATLKHYELKQYKDKDGKNVVLLKSPGMEPPLGIGSKDDLNLSNANFSVSGGGKDITLNGDRKSGSLIFEYAGSGSSVKGHLLFSVTSMLSMSKMRQWDCPPTG